MFYGTFAEQKKVIIIKKKLKLTRIYRLIETLTLFIYFNFCQNDEVQSLW